MPSKMPRMVSNPPVQLSRLREIGWKLWDPIGLARPDGTSDNACADEYDSYLLQVVAMLGAGGSEQDASDFLTDIASRHMGLSQVNREAAEATAKALAEYVASLPNDLDGSA